MDQYLLELGMSDVKLHSHKKQRVLDATETQQLLQTILDVEQFAGSIERKGVPFQEFLLERDAQGRYARFYVSVGEGERKFLYSEEEFAAIAASDETNQRKSHEETLASIPAEEVTDEMRAFRPRPLPCIEIYDAKQLIELSEKLEAFGCTFDQYNRANGSLFDLMEEGEKSTPLHMLREVVDALRINGRKGLDIQRYKGLGEMNAEQLWETTMDPEKRTLVRVTLPDAIAADHMFSMLMGEEVGPRRAFIEHHALSVKNLDI